MTRIKTQPFATRAEFEAALDTIASHQNLLDALKARHDRRVLRLLADYGEVSKPYRDEMDLLTARAEKFAEDHRETLLPKERKSAETPLATYGWRKGNQKLVTLKKWTWDKVLEKLQALHLLDHVRTKSEVNRESILEAAKVKGVLEIRDADHDGATIEVPIADVGLAIEQEESFFIEPKIDDAKRIATPAATA